MPSTARTSPKERLRARIETIAGLGMAETLPINSPVFLE